MMTSCARSHILNIDTFCNKFNESCQEQIARTDFVTADTGEDITSYYAFTDNILLSIISDKNTMNIKNVSVTAVSFSDRFKDICEAVAAVVSEYDKEDALNVVNELFSDNEKEYANEMHTLKFITIIYTKTSSGCRLNESYNEEIPTETTTVPETAEEYNFENVTSSTSSPLCVYSPFRQQYMCCRAEKPDFF